MDDDDINNGNEEDQLESQESDTKVGSTQSLNHNNDQDTTIRIINNSSSIKQSDTFTIIQYAIPKDLSCIQSTSSDSPQVLDIHHVSSRPSSPEFPKQQPSTSRTNIYRHHVMNISSTVSPAGSCPSSPAVAVVNFPKGKDIAVRRNVGDDNKQEKLFQLSKNSDGGSNQQQTKKTSMNTSDPVNNILEIERINFENHHHDNNNHDSDDDNGNEDIHRLNPMGDRRSNRSRSSSNNQNIDYLLSLFPPTELNEMPFEDPIQICGNGNITLFGLSNCYQSTFPSALLGRVSKEEFEYTINKVNHLLQQQHSTNVKFLLLGCLCCCFSLGCSLLWPTFALSRRTKNSLEKFLAMENSRLYNKLGLNWRLSKQPSHTNHLFMEYILVIDFLPKIHIYQPD